MDPTERSTCRHRAIVTACACAAQLAVMFGLGWLSVRTKSPTMDEPLHATGAFAHVFHGDWRINPEDPPLWNYWAVLPHSRASLRLDFTDADWLRALENTDYQSRFCSRTLFQTPGNDGVRFIQRTRLMMLLAAVLMLGPLIAWWGWKLGGAGVAVGATLMFALDPNFLAHAPLVKNDVPMSLVMLLLAASTWAVGRRLTWLNAPLPCLACGIGLGVKFSALLLGPMLLAMLVARALLPAPWTCFNRQLRGRGPKLLVALGVCVAAALLSISIVWASYGFRFDATPAPGSRLPMHNEVAAAARWQFFLDNKGRFPTDEQLAQTAPRPFVRAVLWAEENRLLPQPWLYGLLFTYRSTLARGTFLLGEYSDTGWWYYFPLAMLFKTPLATLGAFALALFATVKMFRARAKDHGSARGFDVDRWTIICLSIPVIIYGFSALASNLNLGLRHVLPLYPFLYLLAALAIARAAQTWRKLLRPAVLVLGLALAAETFVSFPDFIPFFNAVFKPHRLRFLSDSNLDWGQDLPALAAWQARNHDELLHLCYFGTTDPAVYGIDYVNLPGGFWLNETYQWIDPRGRGVVAISATPLQGVNVPPSLRAYYAPLRDVEPLEVLGGSIYLYRLPLPPDVDLRRPTRQ